MKEDKHVEVKPTVGKEKVIALLSVVKTEILFNDNFDIFNVIHDAHTAVPYMREEPDSIKA